MDGQVTGRQLTFDGREVPVVNPPKHPPPLTHVQASIMERMRRDGSITSTAAGLIVHGEQTYRNRYASADGLEAMKRLQKRGLAHRDPAKLGRWLPS